MPILKLLHASQYLTQTLITPDNENSRIHTLYGTNRK